MEDFYVRVMASSEEFLYSARNFTKKKYGDKVKILFVEPVEPYELAHVSNYGDLIFAKAAAKFQHLMRFEE